MNELLFEIGCEEIPARIVPEALAYLGARAEKLSAERGLPITGDVRVYGSPRRLALSITGLGDATARSKKELLGPSVKAAFDAEGKPTRAAEGFAKTVGVAPSALGRKTTPKGEYLFAEVEEGGTPAAAVLESFLNDVLAAMPFPKSMRWGDEDVKFSRPVQWLLAVFSGGGRAQVLPVKLGTLEAGCVSRGHRFMANDPFEARSREEYLARLRERFVIADPAERKQRVLEEARRAAKEAGGFLFYDVEGGASFRDDPLTRDTYFTSLLDEVTHLCESPFGVYGTFERAALDLPREVVLAAMRNHQRYFAVCDAQGELLPAFVTIAASRVKDPAVVRRGNERVLKARLSDASYFFVADQKRSLAERVDDLKAVTYHKKIGTSYEKVERVQILAMEIAKAIGHVDPPRPSELDAYVRDPQVYQGGFFGQLGRAVALSKADLTTLMVGEFPELQGIVGAHYAKRSGETAEVVLAIRDHYRPRSAEDAPAESELAAIVAIADKLDTIAGIVAIGQLPSGSSDPFALRRAALGILRTLFAREYDVQLDTLLASPPAGVHESMEDAINRAHQKINASYSSEVVSKIMSFLADRFLNYLLPDKPGRQADAVRAVVAAGVNNPLRAQRRVLALQSFVENEEFPALAETLKRAANILKEKVEGAVDAGLLEAAEEKKLHAELLVVATDCAKLRSAGTVAAYSGILAHVARLRIPVDEFFKAVMVMDKNPAVKQNRLRLLRDIVALTADIADFTKL